LTSNSLIFYGKMGMSFPYCCRHTTEKISVGT
jgi:hypothetical protein